MSKYETKTWKTAKKNLESEIANREHFGWEFVSNSVDNSSSVITLTMKRDLKREKGRRLRSLNRQARILEMKFPMWAIIWLAVGVAFFIPWIFLYSNVYLIFLLITAVTAWTVSLFLFLVFIVTRFKKKTLLEELYREGDELLGKLKVKPTEKNIMVPGPNSFHLRRMIITLINKKD